MTYVTKVKQLVNELVIGWGMVKGDFEPSLSVLLHALSQETIACQVGLHIISLELSSALIDVVGVGSVDPFAVKPHLTEGQVKIRDDLNRCAAIADGDHVHVKSTETRRTTLDCYGFHSTDAISSHK